MMRWRGTSARSNTVSLMRCGVSRRPAIAGSIGEEPVAMTKWRARIARLFTATVRSSVKRAAPSMTCTPRPAMRWRAEFGATAPMTSFTCALTAAKSTPKRVVFMPKRAPLRDAFARSAAAISACSAMLPFFLRRSPPMRPFSMSTARASKAAAAAAAERPPAPAPITQISGLSSCAISLPTSPSLARFWRKFVGLCMVRMFPEVSDLSHTFSIQGKWRGEGRSPSIEGVV